MVVDHHSACLEFSLHVPLYNVSLHDCHVTCRTVFYYRGNEMMAVRYDMYKAHYWTWSNSLEEYQQVLYVCVGEGREGREHKQ